MPPSDPNIWQWVPFIGLAVNSGKDNIHSPWVVRLIEAAIVGAVTMYGTTEKLGERITGLEKRLEQRAILADHRMDRIETRLDSGNRR